MNQRIWNAIYYVSVVFITAAVTSWVVSWFAGTVASAIAR